MTYVISIVTLAAAWAAITGNFTVANLLFGLALATVLMLVSRHRSSFLFKTGAFFRFVFIFVIELVLANLRVARDVLSPHPSIAPGVVGIPLKATTDVEITVIANLISLTPGTLTLDVSDDRRVLYIHSIYMDDVEALADSVTNGVERRTLELLR